ncbi:MAG: glycosyltransferase family 2 protein [Lachnospiraceae bacterium]|nr:glycosyltransferase family 2 protein [Lachnospiraceae bacterium]
MERISIIVPVYNAENSLKRCIESVLLQNYTDWELLLIDDGSSDRSYDICLEYSRGDQRIRCIHTENFGRVHARKTGMRNARGELVTFLDSDDWLEPDTLLAMYSRMAEASADCVAAGYIENLDESEAVILNRIPPGTYRGRQLQENFYPFMLCCDHFFESGVQPFLCNKLFRRRIIEKMILTIDERLVVGEDVLCVYPALLEADSIVVMDNAFYHYYIHSGSTTKTYRTKQAELENIRLQYVYLKSVFEQSSHSECLIQQLERYLLHHLMVRAFPCISESMGKPPFYIFGEIPAGSRIILYGAGALGKSIYHYLSDDVQFAICGWCDKEASKYRRMGYPVRAVEDVVGKAFDYILIAVLKQKTAEIICSELLFYGVDVRKIMWLDMTHLQEYNFSNLL